MVVCKLTAVIWVEKVKDQGDKNDRCASVCLIRFSIIEHFVSAIRGIVRIRSTIRRQMFYSSDLN